MKRRQVVCWCLLIVFVVVGTPIVRADDDFKITPDVIYGHKAGMALTFDVVQPKKPNGVGIMFMMSGGWVSAWIPPRVHRWSECAGPF